MKRIASVILLLFATYCLLSCNHQNKLEERMDAIKEVGDTNPKLAIKMADSLEAVVRNQPQKTTMKYDLLKIRLNDKAYISATSDIIIKQVVDYYQKNGDNEEKQEAFYYAGSVYRDLQDTPQALNYFLKSAYIAEKDTMCNRTMLRNTYSNLSYLYYNVQDYNNTLKNAQKEYHLAKKIGAVKLSCYSYLALSLINLNRFDEARKYLQISLDTISRNINLQKDREIISNLLLQFSFLKDTKDAQRCRKLLNDMSISYMPNDELLALGGYYEMTGKTDSAKSAYQQILRNGPDLFKIYDATKALLCIYHQEGNLRDLDKYTSMYIEVSDSIDLKIRQENAASVNNMFQYHRNKSEEQELKDHRDNMVKLAIFSTAASICVLLLSIIIFLYQKYKKTKESLAVSNQLNKLENEKMKMKTFIINKENEVKETKDKLQITEMNLQEVQETYKSAQQQLESANEEIQRQEQILTERLSQNKILLNMLHQSEMKAESETTLETIRKAAEGKNNLTLDDWKLLFTTVDTLYPDFKNQLMDKQGTLTEDKMRFCYLLRIGLPMSLIRNLINKSRATIWRWAKEYDWIISLP